MYEFPPDAITEEIPRPGAAPAATPDQAAPPDPTGASVLRSRGTPGPTLVQLRPRPRVWDVPDPVALQRSRGTPGVGCVSPEPRSAASNGANADRVATGGSAVPPPPARIRLGSGR